jgi:hypothetical protein
MPLKHISARFEAQIACLPLDARLYERAQQGDIDCADALEVIDHLQAALHGNDARDDDIRFALLWFAHQKVSGNQTTARIAELMEIDLGGATS